MIRRNIFDQDKYITVLYTKYIILQKLESPKTTVAEENIVFYRGIILFNVLRD